MRERSLVLLRVFEMDSILKYEFRAASTRLLMKETARTLVESKLSERVALETG